MLYSSRRSKGNKFEYDTEYSLKAKYPDIRALERRGFAKGYDLFSEERCVYVECKFHKTICWNELTKWFGILTQRAPAIAILRFIVFKTNHQPVLVFNGRGIKLFEDEFGVPFKTRPKEAKQNENK